MPLVSPPPERPEAAPERPWPSLSVIIGCYNYARFLKVAIDSVLNENLGAQVIVVDDCSTDNSRDIIRSYGDRIIPVFLAQNSGQGAGFNAGWARATGELVYFLDADDFVLPGALRRALECYDPDALVYHFRMRYSDENGTLAGLHPAPQVPLGTGDVSRQLREQGRYHTTVTSGLIFARAGLERVMPIPAEAYRMSAEGYLVAVVPMYGPTLSFQETLSSYRLHDAQNWKAQQDFGARARKSLRHDIHRYAAIRDHAARLGLPVAENLGDADLLHLNDRLISLTFAPADHPFTGDSAARVIRLAKAVRIEGAGPRAAFGKQAWWTLIGLLPSGPRRQILRWKTDPKTRPAWLASSGRFLRQRLGIVIR
jgi:glycosyltransferase involved in cell wall biosynthesis